MNKEQHDYLKRLPPEYYRGQAYVHWSLSMKDRKTGWLIPIFYYKYREILTHTAFRFGLCCPIYCCMPDHIHLLWMGILDDCDQRKAMRYFRRQLNPVLEKLDARFQDQPYDHVLREEKRERGAFEQVAEYIARNPERRGLVGAEEFATYPYTDVLCLGTLSSSRSRRTIGIGSGASTRTCRRTACTWERAVNRSSCSCSWIRKNSAR